MTHIIVRQSITTRCALLNLCKLRLLTITTGILIEAIYSFKIYDLSSTMRRDQLEN